MQTREAACQPVTTALWGHREKGLGRQLDQPPSEDSHIVGIEPFVQLEGAR